MKKKDENVVLLLQLSLMIKLSTIKFDFNLSAEENWNFFRETFLLDWFEIIENTDNLLEHYLSLRDEEYFNIRYIEWRYFFNEGASYVGDFPPSTYEETLLFLGKKIKEKFLQYIKYYYSEEEVGRYND